MTFKKIFNWTFKRVLFVRFPEVELVYLWFFCSCFTLDMSENSSFMSAIPYNLLLNLNTTVQN